MAGFGDQVSIMTQINPEVEKVLVFAFHGGTAIYLFMGKRKFQKFGQMYSSG